MALKKISDIRLFKSAVKNEKGSYPESITCPTLADYASRLAVRLRQTGFKLDGFDRLYVDFNCTTPEGVYKRCDRPADKVFPGYRFYEVGVSRYVYENLDNEKMLYFVINSLRLLFINCFMYGDNNEEQVTKVIYEIAKYGEEVALDLKEKSNGEYSVNITYRFMNDGKILPVAEVTRLSDGKSAKFDLPETDGPDQVGEIRFLKTSIIVKIGRESGYSGVREAVIDLSRI